MNNNYENEVLKYHKKKKVTYLKQRRNLNTNINIKNVYCNTSITLKIMYLLMKKREDTYNIKQLLCYMWENRRSIRKQYCNRLSTNKIHQ